MRRLLLSRLATSRAPTSTHPNARTRTDGGISHLSCRILAAKVEDKLGMGGSWRILATRVGVGCLEYRDITRASRAHEGILLRPVFPRTFDEDKFALTFDSLDQRQRISDM